MKIYCRAPLTWALAMLLALPVWAQAPSAAFITSGAQGGMGAGSGAATPPTGLAPNAAVSQAAAGTGALGLNLGATAPATAAGMPAPVGDPFRTQDALATERMRAQRVLPASQFQRFVQEATGRLLPIYGSELFQGPQTFNPDTALPVPTDYMLGVGDEVRLQVWGAVDYSGSHTLDRNGQISLPKVGALVLAGVPLRDLENVLRAQLGKVFANFSLNANLGRLRAVQVYVVGQAQQPGAFQLSSLSTLVNAVFASGGPNANGSMRNIQLKRAGQTVATLDLYDFIAKGDKGQDIPLRAGDVIVIPPVGPRVAVTGALDQAAIYELTPAATTVGDILALTGGVPTLATVRKALIERVVPDQRVPRQVQDLALDAQGLKLPLRDGDVLTLLPISPAFANAVTLQGTVAAPLRYRWFEGMRIRDLIPERDALITPDYYKRKNLLVQSMDEKEAGSKVVDRVRGLADQINWDYAVIERMDHSQLSTEVLPFNLGKAVLQRDPDHNLELLAGDVVTILRDNDLQLPMNRKTLLVRVEGEVAAPGIYQAQPGETLPQLLARIGGLTPQAYVFGAELSRESVRSRQQQNLEALIRRLETQSQSQGSTLVANLSGDRAAQAQALQQQQQAQLKSQIERLKSARSNGRLALELNPSSQGLTALPQLRLEDGDRILIPAVPGFVSAFGSVNNENVFIFKSGKTVADVVRSAGLTEDAEPDQAFVLRADGSIVSRRDRGGWFRLDRGFDGMQLMPGDTVVVPAMLDRESRYNFVIRAAKDWTQILSNFGLGVAALKTLRN